MRITEKGQVTIPIGLRRRYGLEHNTEVEFVADGHAVRIVKPRRTGGRGRAIVQRLRGRGTVRMSTDQIMALTRGHR